MRLATFLNVIGDEGWEKYNSFTFADAEESKNLDKVIKEFDYHCNDANILFERYMFLKKKYKPHKNIETFTTALRLLGGDSQTKLRYRNLQGTENWAHSENDVPNAWLKQSE